MRNAAVAIATGFRDTIPQVHVADHGGADGVAKALGFATARRVVRVGALYTGGALMARVQLSGRLPTADI